MSHLNESGVQDDIKCPYCGWDSAESHYDRHGVTNNVEGMSGWEYTTYEYCNICGWSLLSLDDDSYTDLIDYIYDKYGQEEADARMPPQEKVTVPNLQNVKTAKKIIPLINKMYSELSDDGTEILWEFLEGEWHPREKDKRTPNDFYHMFIN